MMSSPGEISSDSPRERQKPTVSLVVPGRNAERTLGSCLAAAKPLLLESRLQEIVFVDDGSSDSSASIARQAGVTCFLANGVGPGAARNLGWRAGAADLVWFIDADCVVEPDTLERLLKEMADAGVGGVGGSYSNAVPQSILARLIHAEIRARHATMQGDVDYLGSFNALYRRSALEQVGGFDESWVNGPGAPGGEDADLSFRVTAAGHRLRFCGDARVAHHHPVSLWGYFRAQRVHGFWGVRLYRRHPDRARGNSYSSQLDHLQPLLALVALVSAPLAFWPPFGWVPLALFGLLVLSTLPMTLRLMGRRGSEMALFCPLATLRAFARSMGMAWGVLDMLTPGQWRPRR